MKIQYKRIEHERTEDAPFIGALVCSITCNLSCEGCFHQYLKKELTKEIECDDLIKEIKNNPFNRGIILAGLEWTLQPKELRELIVAAKDAQLEIILYTGLTEEKFKEEFEDLLNLPIYIKFGEYNKELSTIKDKVTGILLASNNQKIVKYGN